MGKVITSCRDFPYKFVLPRTKRLWEVQTWCEQQFGLSWDAIGNRDGVWCCFWAGTNSPKDYEWFFKNEKDATVFLLRWA